MKNIITALLIALTVLVSGSMAEAKSDSKKITITEVFMVESITGDNFLDLKPVDPKLKGGYILENNGKYNLGDIVSITYSGDKTLKDYKVTGNELKKIENKYDTYINSMIEESMRKSYNAEVKSKKVTGVSGVSVNTTKVNHSVKDKAVRIAVKNDNNYTVGVELQPEKLVKGEWVELDWYDFDFLEPEDKNYYNHTIKKDFMKKSGNYRYHVKVTTYDKNGFAKSSRLQYTKQFVIK